MQGQDIALLLKLATQNAPQVPPKDLAESLFISPSEVSKSLQRSVKSGLLHIANGEKRVDQSALMEVLSHGFKYVFPPAKGFLARRPHGCVGGAFVVPPSRPTFRTCGSNLT